MQYDENAEKYGYEGEMTPMKCDELKAYIAPTPDGTGLADYYLKSEADKVIADKDKEIQRLENLCESYRIDCDNLAIREANAYKEIGRDNKRIRHNKYKRCLAMARWCDASMAYFGEFYDDASKQMVTHYYKWSKRWLELAEKFKEAK